MSAGLTLVCPVRGRLKALARGADGLTPTEELYRVEAIRHLISLGYPKENIRVEAVIKRFGNSGRNSFRADIAVLDVPVATVSSDVDDILRHAVLLGEVKRDNAGSERAIAYQVKPMLDFTVREDCVALYWDNVEQRVFWRERRGKKTRIDREGPLADLPGFGQEPGAKRLTFATIDPDKPLLAVFRRIEDILHAGSIGPSKRFSIMLQLLLSKLHDEHQHEHKPDDPLTLQDFEALGVEPDLALTEIDKLLERAVQFYQPFMPEKVATKLAIPAPVAVEVMKVLAPIKIINMRQSVIQDFYMYFAKHIYKWDLAQYFTPTLVTDFIVEILNPRWGEHVKDPACGSADFLTAAFRRGHEQGWTDYASSIWGTDISPEAVQVAVLNMILNGDGKSNVTQEDALAKARANASTCDVVVCNPPFGTRITETRASTLGEFELGHSWTREDDGSWTMDATVLTSQETGLLFAEACIRLLRPGGRLALVVPNGYLGNRSPKYLLTRDWLLRHARLSAIVALPRFTFKGSGADVSASVIFLEKRAEPLAVVGDDTEYSFAVEVVDRVGWATGDKKALPTYVRDPDDGTFILSEDGEVILDCDFDAILERLRRSEASDDHPWLVEGLGKLPADEDEGWSVRIADIVADEHLTLDPKRLSRKANGVVSAISAVAHFELGDVVEFLPERHASSGEEITLDDATEYRYVEIQDVGVGTFGWTTRRGWELPSRARHLAEPGEFYVGAIWGSVKKWFAVGPDAENLIVTNGMHRLRVREGMEDHVLDLMAGLSSEAYAVQMRSLARGSDGLAEVTADDAAHVVLPRITDKSVRAELQPFVDQIAAGFTTVEAKVAALIQNRRIAMPIPPRRPDHTSLV